MGFSARIEDLEAAYRCATTPPRLINEFDVSLTDEVERLNHLVYTHYEGDTLSIVPSCDCGHITGEYNHGIVCPICHTEVLTVTERPLESLLWIAPPKGGKSFVNPRVWSILSGVFTHRTINYLEWFCDPLAQLPESYPPFVDRLNKLGLERGLDAFIEHFDEYWAIFNEQGLFNAKPQTVEATNEFVRRYRNVLFTRFLPVPSRLSFITEGTVTGSYADDTMVPMIDAIRTVSATEFSNYPLSKARVQSRMCKIQRLVSEYHRLTYADSIAGKTGLYRKNIYGARLHFTYRAVIVSIAGPHRYDELHLPWSLSVQLFRTHLTSKLFRRGFNPRAASRQINEAVTCYDPLIDELFHELIRESRGGLGIPTLLGRNPTLQRGSIQRFYISKIKTDVTDNAIGLSVMVLKAPNADKLTTHQKSHQVTRIVQWENE